MASPLPEPALTTSIEYLCRRPTSSFSIIRIQNLSTKALVGGAIWGISGGNERHNKLQPVSISASLALRIPFESAAESDEVNDSTVNYSTLSKEILKVVESRRPDVPHSDGFEGLSKDWSLYDLAEWLYIYLARQTLSNKGTLSSGFEVAKFIDGGCPCLKDIDTKEYKPPVLDISKLKELEIKIFLPKASLLSGGVSLTTSLLQLHPPSQQFRSVLKIYNLHIPTLIGINANERLAKQLVIINVEIDPYITREHDRYNELEQIIVKSTEESSFGTLESLATHLCGRILKFFIYAYAPHITDHAPDTSIIPRDDHMCHIRICLEKPCAITFADAPSIEILREADPNRSEVARRLLLEWESLVTRNGLSQSRIPFPLQGSLSEWISENCPGDTTKTV